LTTFGENEILFAVLLIDKNPIGCASPKPNKFKKVIEVFAANKE